MPANTSVNQFASNFTFKKNYIKADKTGAPYRTAHPDSTILAAGHARYVNHGGDVTGIDKLTLIGATTSIAVNETQQVQPIKELGSSRHIMTTANAPVSIQASSLLINGPNFLKAIYGATRLESDYASLMTQGGAGSSVIGNPLDGAEANINTQPTDGWANLDHPVFQIPFGLAIITQSVGGDDILAVYAEVCLIQNWTWTSAAGQTAVFSNASIICDRIVPFPATSLTAITDQLDTLAQGASKF